MTTTTTRAAKKAVPESRYVPEDGLLLDVEDLHVEFHTADGIAKAINGVSFQLRQGETLAILGESARVNR